MKKLSPIQAGWLYAFIHFSIEVACFYFLCARALTGPMAWIMAVAYDALAFVPQCFFGIWLDKKAGLMMGPAGCALALAALLIPWDIPALIIICTGNALVHIDGAQKTLKGPQIAPCGIYVGGGSFGVIAGQLLGKTGFGAAVIIPIALICAAIYLTILLRRRNITADDGGPNVDSGLNTGLLCLLMFAVVAIRSYIGYAIPTGWNKTAWQAVLLFCIMGAGKMLGGLLADRIGYRRTAWVSLGLALPFLLFGNSAMIISLIGVGLFSMTMPLTIGVLVSRLEGMPCFAFGITTVALFIGTLPSFFVRPDGLLMHQALVLILCTAALLCLIPCVRKGR